jgi:murein DD-endopeptidase MepM/ murein hydrolase activator NlpD
MAAKKGTPIYATADGVVLFSDDNKNYGLFIRINHENSYESRYAHLSKLVAKKGKSVKKGDLIGYVGSTGKSTGPHLHYSIKRDGKFVNPLPYFKKK